MDTQFHAIIIFQGNNKEHVWEAITRLSTHYNRMRVLSEMELECTMMLIVEHREIVSIIEEYEIDKVEQALYKHIMKPAELWESFYKPDSPYLDYFDLTYRIPLFK